MTIPFDLGVRRRRRCPELSEVDGEDVEDEGSSSDGSPAMGASLDLGHRASRLFSQDQGGQEKTGLTGTISGHWSKVTEWVLEVEMGVVWALSGLSLISFIFTSIWYIDPALLTMVLQFQPADCTTNYSAYLVGISNCSWTSCRHGCTAEIFKCWHIIVNYTLVSGSRPIPPPWASLTNLPFIPYKVPGLHQPRSRKLYNNKDLAVVSDLSLEDRMARLYPNARGCGYPPKLDCNDFFGTYGDPGEMYPCWVSHMDPTIALSHLDLKKLKEEVMYSLVPLASFILTTLYALCRLRVFSICNPFRCCPQEEESAQQSRLTPKQLFRYKKALMARKNNVMEEADDRAEGEDPRPYDLSSQEQPPLDVEAEDEDKGRPKDVHDDRQHDNDEQELKDRLLADQPQVPQIDRLPPVKESLERGQLRGQYCLGEAAELRIEAEEAIA